MSIAPGTTLNAFEKGQIDAQGFDHESHVYIGWLYLQSHSLTEAIERYCRALRQLTSKLGVPGKYHETITWFFMLQIAERCNRGDQTDWNDFQRRNPDLFRAGDLLSRYYSRELLATDLARTGFVLPDRLAMDPVRTGR